MDATAPAIPLDDVLFSHRFEAEGDFAALEAARRALTAAGFSLGSLQKGAPTGVILGDARISKWRNLRQHHRDRLHGVLEGDARNGAVRLTLNTRCPGDGVQALRRALDREAA